MNDPGYRILPWDSEFFGVRIAQIDAAAFVEPHRPGSLQWCHEQRIDCAYLFVDSANQGLLMSRPPRGFGWLIFESRCGWQRAMSRTVKLRGY